MYGLVNRGVQDLVVELGGEDAWAAVQEAAGVEVVEFLATQTYDDEVTGRLVSAAAEHFGLTPAEVLRAFGRHWILYTGRQGYGALMDAFGSSMLDFLGHLDGMHEHVTLTMPELRPPRFSHEVLSDGTIMLRYHSDRDGLEEMVVGLLAGLGEKFGSPVEASIVRTEPDGAVLFHVVPLGTGARGDRGDTDRVVTV